MISTTVGSVLIKQGKLEKGTINDSDFNDLVDWLDGQISEEAIKKWSPWTKSAGWICNDKFYITGVGIQGYIRQRASNVKDICYFDSFDSAKKSVTINT